MEPLPFAAAAIAVSARALSVRKGLELCGPQLVVLLPQAVVAGGRSEHSTAEDLQPLGNPAAEGNLRNAVDGRVELYEGNVLEQVAAVASPPVGVECEAETAPDGPRDADRFEVRQWATAEAVTRGEYAIGFDQRPTAAWPGREPGHGLLGHKYTAYHARGGGDRRAADQRQRDQQAHH